MTYDLPASLEVCGTEYNIRSDFRAVLDIFAALMDCELDNQEKAFVALKIFYPDFDQMPSEHFEEALKRCFWFINCGDENTQNRKVPKLMDWEQDFQYIVAPINRILGKDIRGMKYLHWWSFISAYYEIGDCLFAQIIRIRDQKARGKTLDKADREWYQKNRQLVDFKATYTEAEQDIFKQWGM